MWVHFGLRWAELATDRLNYPGSWLKFTADKQIESAQIQGLR